jgi:DNA-binding LytR/AlgR family response regulator
LQAVPSESEGALAATLKRLLPGPPAQAPLRFIRAAQGELMHQVSVDEVLFFHADDKYTVVQTRERELLIRTPIQELIPQLDPERFWQIHRSTVVNLDVLAGTRRDEMSRLFVRLKDVAREFPVSRAYVHLFKAM